MRLNPHREGAECHWHTRLGMLLLVAALRAVPVSAQIPESIGTRELPAPGPHWVWIDDDAYHTELDGRAWLVDADSGALLGMLSTGLQFQNLQLPRAYDHIYSAETYYTRGSRGERTDVISIYDPTTLEPEGEIVIPPKRQNGVAMTSYTGTTDDDRFMLVYNFTPAQSVTVADLVARTFVGEIATPGCALVYPGGVRRFATLCGDGTLLTVDLADDGSEAARARSGPFFDPAADPITEKGVRLGDRWLFASFGGMIHAVDIGDSPAQFATPWPIVTTAERRTGWRISGYTHLAVHAATRTLYALMHRGGPETRKDPGTEVWVFEAEGGPRVRRIRLAEPALSLEVTPDDAPLLLALGDDGLQVYDAASGRHLRTIAGIGSSLSLVQALPLRSR
jgi:methylamine dehydrogenase heavy chain